MPSKFFVPNDSYFIASDLRVFSTSRMTEVPSTDAAYVAWLATGQVPMSWPGDESELAIRAVLQPYGYPCTEISNRQFYQQLAIAGIITDVEALAVMTSGVLPAAIEAIVVALPSGQQFGARMLLTGASVFERNHPLVTVCGASQGMTAVQIDAFFRAAALL